MSAIETPLQELENLDQNETEDEIEEGSPATLFLEDFVVTALLSAGRPLRAGELAARADGFSPSRHGLKQALRDSKRLVFEGRDWDVVWRHSRQGLTREERSRQPIESMIQELLLAVGKPLPVAVIAREVSLMRHQFDPQMKTAVANVLKTARFALETGPDVWLHQNFVLTLGAPSEETLIRANKLGTDPDFQGLIEFAEVTKTDPGDIAVELMEFTGGPLNQKVIGFFARRSDPATFSSVKVTQALSDRNRFTFILEGFVALKEHVPDLKAGVQSMLEHIGGDSSKEIDVNALLKARVAASEVIAPRLEEIEEVRKLAKAADGTPVSLASVVLDLFEMEPADPKLVPTLQGLNEALRKHADFMPAGIGRFILRESIPAFVGETPQLLRPVLLETLDPETGESFDFEMTDEGVEGDSSDFIHSAEWEDVAEEIEVRVTRRPTNAPNQVRYVLLNHHLRAGTIKLRRMDEEFFEMSGPIARLPLRSAASGEQLTAWASRDAGLIYGLGPWLNGKVLASGSVLFFKHEENGYTLTIEEADPSTAITAERAEELSALVEQARYLSLYELLRKILAAHKEGVELVTLWAEVNMVRRTSKRLMCSILSGYNGFYFKQRGPKQLFWRYDADKTEQGFKKNKRKYVLK